jgi:hypothetical protein
VPICHFIFFLWQSGQEQQGGRPWWFCSPATKRPKGSIEMWNWKRGSRGTRWRAHLGRRTKGRPATLVNAAGGELGHQGRRRSRGGAARGRGARVRGEGSGGLYRRGARGLPWRARPGPAGCRRLTAAAASGLARWASPGLATGLAGAGRSGSGLRARPKPKG